jgi:predicted dithiol-disulfide oxidoreductase (DUF899 family)
VPLLFCASAGQNFDDGYFQIPMHRRSTMTTGSAVKTNVVSKEEWLAARKELLVKEKALTRQTDAVAWERLNLPWEKVEKNYVFEGPNGRKSLADLFDGRSQLMVYHFMFGPEWKEGCPSCSLLADHFDGVTTHLANRDINLVAVSRAPYSLIEPFKTRMGWKFKWISSNGSDFNFDYHVSFTKDEIENKNMYYNYGQNAFPADEAPGVSVFYKDAAGNIFHTYSTFARGAEALLGVYNFFDMSPKGRDEESLPWPMAWVRHHDKYDQTYSSESTSWQPQQKSAAHSCCAPEKHA